MTLSMNQQNHSHPIVTPMSDDYFHHTNYNSNYARNNNLPPNNPQIWSNPNSPFGQIVPQHNQFQNAQYPQSYPLIGNVERPVRTRESLLNNTPRKTTNVEYIYPESINAATQSKHFSLMNRNKQFRPISSKNTKIKRSEKIKCIAALEQYQTYCKEQIRINFLISGIQSHLIYPTEEAMTPEISQFKNRNTGHIRPNQNPNMASQEKTYEYLFKKQLTIVNDIEPGSNVQDNRGNIGTTNQQTTQMQIQPNRVGLDVPSRHRANSHQGGLFRQTSNQVGQIQQNSNAAVNVMAIPAIPQNNNNIPNNSIQNCYQGFYPQQNLQNLYNFPVNGISSDVNTFFIWFCLSFPKQFAFFNGILLDKITQFTNSLRFPPLFSSTNHPSNIVQKLLSIQMSSPSHYNPNDMLNSMHFDFMLKSSVVVRDFASLFGDLLNLYKQALLYKNIGFSNEQIRDGLLLTIKLKLAELPLQQPGIEQILKAILVQFYQYASQYTYPCPFFIMSSLSPDTDIDRLAISPEMRRQIFKCQRSTHNEVPPESWKPFLSRGELPNCGQFEIQPSLKFLQFMSRSDIRKVEGVQIWSIHGKIQFLQPVNLYNKNIARSVVIRQNTIQLYDNDFKIVKCRKTFFNYGRYQELTAQGQDILVEKIRILLRTQKMKLVRFDDKYGDLVVQC